MGKCNILVIEEETTDNVSYSKSAVSSGFLHKINDKDEFIAMFKEEPISIYKHDCHDIISLIQKDGSEISLHDFHLSGKNIKDILFFKISAGILEKSGNELLIYTGGKFMVPAKTFKLITGKPFPERISDGPFNDDESFGETENDMDGYINCQKLKETYTNKKIPAVRFCDRLKLFDDNGNMYHGYLPAIGQMKIIKEFLNVLYFILGHKPLLDGDDMLTIDLDWLSSTYYEGTTYAWSSWPGQYLQDASKQFFDSHLWTTEPSRRIDQATFWDATRYEGLVFPVFKKMIN